jgi:hypothetical protein
VWRFLIFSRHDDSYTVDYGSLPDPTQLSYITAGTGTGTTAANGSVSITANNVNNLGGVIQSTNGDVDITAQQGLTNQAYFTGQARYTQSCFIFCSSHASSDIQIYGGQIQAGGNVSLTAGTVAQNIGGNVLAVGGNLTVTAPLTIAQGLLDYTTYNRDQGLKAFLGSDWATIYADDTGGLFEASGDVTLLGDGNIDGGQFIGGSGVSASGGITTSQAPYHGPVTIGNHLGLISWLGL